MQHCADCGVEQTPDNSYLRATRGPNHFQGYCKPCKYIRDAGRWVNRKKQAIEYLGNSCVRCGNSYEYPAMQFHHRDPSTKEMGWNKMRLGSWKSITRELNKCDLICANCHAIIHSLLKP